MADILKAFRFKTYNNTEVTLTVRCDINEPDKVVSASIIEHGDKPQIIELTGQAVYDLQESLSIATASEDNSVKLRKVTKELGELQERLRDLAGHVESIYSPGSTLPFNRACEIRNVAHKISDILEDIQNE